MPDKPFVHLHLHTQYSFLKSLVKFEPLAKKVSELGMEAVAITDQGCMFGAVQFQGIARKSSIKPLLGAEVNVTPGPATEKTGKPRDSFHLQLLVINDKGYHNLCQLLTKGYFDGFYYTPRVDHEMLAQHSEGLIAITASMRGEVATLQARGQRPQALEAAQFLATTYGENNVYLELQDLGWDGQAVANEQMRAIAAEVGLPTVVTNHVHYLDQEDAYPHEVLMCLGSKRILSDVGRFRFPSDQFYLKSPEQMWALFPDDEEALRNTVAIADRCEFAFPDETTYHFPTHPDLEDQDPVEALAKVSWEGLEQRLVKVKERLGDEQFIAMEPVYRERLEEELGIIKEMGFPTYFLIVHDFVRWAKENDVPVGPGRGSGAGSLVLYSLRITEIDPLRFDLLFERFLNPERISMPDVDIDFCQEKRELVIRYVNETYGGRERVCQIITYGKMLAKAVVQDVGRVMGMEFADRLKIGKAIPNQIGITLEKAVQLEPKLREMQAADPQVDKLLKIAERLEGNCRQAGVHAAGLVISDRPLVDYLPLAVVSDTVTTQYDMKYAEQIGLVKFDFLGLKTLTQINEALSIARARGRSELTFLEFNEITLGDKAAYKLLTAGDTLGVFQLESSGMRQLISTMKPNRFEDIIAAVALYRPGPMGAGMHTEYVERKHGRAKVSYPHPSLEPILKNTYGIIVYQEQVMQIVQVMADFSLGRADRLRRAMGKKIMAEMEEHRVDFVAGAKAKGIPEKTSEEVYDLVFNFASYGFNKSHSAAYALVAYQTAYLKAHFPEEFFASLLTTESSNTDKVLLYIDDCRQHGIRVLPPDVNESRWRFTVVDEGVRFGLTAVKGVGEMAIQSILEARKEKGGRFDSIDDFLVSVDLQKVNKRVMESLIKCGAFDSLGHTRAALMAGLDPLMESAIRTARDKAIGQASLFGAQETATQFRIPDVPPWPQKEMLAHEKGALGFYITGHPMDGYRDEVKRFASHNTESLKRASDGDAVAMAGILTGVQRKINKRNQPWGVARLEDRRGGVVVKFFAKKYDEFQDVLVEDLPLLVEGKVQVQTDGSVELLGDTARKLEDVRSDKTKQVWIDLSMEAVDAARLKALTALLEGHEGTCSAYLRLTNPGETEVDVRLPKSIKVAASDDLREGVNELFGGPVLRFR